MDSRWFKTHKNGCKIALNCLKFDTRLLLTKFNQLLNKYIGFGNFCTRCKHFYTENKLNMLLFISNAIYSESEIRDMYHMQNKISKKVLFQFVWNLEGLFLSIIARICTRILCQTQFFQILLLFFTLSRAKKIDFFLPITFKKWMVF